MNVGNIPSWILTCRIRYFPNRKYSLTKPGAVALPIDISPRTGTMRSLIYDQKRSTLAICNQEYAILKHYVHNRKSSIHYT